MTDDDLEEMLGADLFQEMVIDHYQNPRNRGRLDPADIAHDGDNPSCGDSILVTASVDDGRVGDIRFEGAGCAISQAAASILYEDVKGKTFDEVLAMDRSTVEEAIGMTLRPARVKCGVLGINSLKRGIETYQKAQEAGAAGSQND